MRAYEHACIVMQFLESMILAQIERWQRALYMQVEREIMPSGMRVERRKGE